MFFNNKYQLKPHWDNSRWFSKNSFNSAQKIFLPICHKKYDKDFFGVKISRGYLSPLYKYQKTSFKKREDLKGVGREPTPYQKLY
jgi:hypothetical protein